MYFFISTIDMPNAQMSFNVIVKFKSKHLTIRAWQTCPLQKAQKMPGSVWVLNANKQIPPNVSLICTQNGMRKRFKSLQSDYE